MYVYFSCLCVSVAVCVELLYRVQALCVQYV